MTVLLVDDDPELRAAMSDFLTDRGYDVVEASNGAEALALARSRSPSLILLDMMMPVMDGSEFLRQRSAEAALLAIPVVVLSAQRYPASNDPSVVAAFLKPAPSKRLLTIVEWFCGGTPARPMELGAVPHTTVLIVDDDPDLCDALADALRPAGYIVAIAHDGVSALALLERTVPDVILLDSQMSRMDAATFMDRWGLNAPSGAPIVLMSGAEQIRRTPAGCAEVLVKPFPLATLLDAVRRLAGN